MRTGPDIFDGRTLWLELRGWQAGHVEDYAAQLARILCIWARLQSQAIGETSARSPLPGGVPRDWIGQPVPFDGSMVRRSCVRRKSEHRPKTNLDDGEVTHQGLPVVVDIRRLPGQSPDFVPTDGVRPVERECFPPRPRPGSEMEFVGRQIVGWCEGKRSPPVSAPAARRAVGVDQSERGSNVGEIWFRDRE